MMTSTKITLQEKFERIVALCRLQLKRIFPRLARRNSTSNPAKLLSGHVPDQHCQLARELHK